MFLVYQLDDLLAFTADKKGPEIDLPNLHDYVGLNNLPHDQEILLDAL